MNPNPVPAVRFLRFLQKSVKMCHSGIPRQGEQDGNNTDMQWRAVLRKVCHARPEGVFKAVSARSVKKVKKVKNVQHRFLRRRERECSTPFSVSGPAGAGDDAHHRCRRTEQRRASSVSKNRATTRRAGSCRRESSTLRIVGAQRDSTLRIVGAQRDSTLRRAGTTGQEQHLCAEQACRQQRS